MSVIMTGESGSVSVVLTGESGSVSVILTGESGSVSVIVTGENGSVSVILTGETGSVSVDSLQSQVSLSKLSSGATYEVSVMSTMGKRESDPLIAIMTTGDHHTYLDLLCCSNSPLQYIIMHSALDVECRTIQSAFALFLPTVSVVLPCNMTTMKCFKT